MASQLWPAYVHALQVNPLWTKSVTAMTLNGLEEVIAQSLSAGGKPVLAADGKSLSIKKGIDYDRVIKMALYGLLISGPLGHYLYRLVDRVFAGRTSALASLVQLVTVNVVAIPIQNYGAPTHATLSA